MNRLAELPYSVDGQVWTAVDYLEKVATKDRYFTYVKDNEGKTNYCERNIIQ